MSSFLNNLLLRYLIVGRLERISNWYWSNLFHLGKEGIRIEHDRYNLLICVFKSDVVLSEGQKFLGTFMLRFLSIMLLVQLCSILAV